MATKPPKRQAPKLQRSVIRWLLDSDPSIRWQVMRDLIGVPADEVAAERARVATEGTGARLLTLQGTDGRWGGAAWNRGWNSTMHVLMLLRDIGLDPASDHAHLNNDGCALWADVTGNALKAVLASAAPAPAPVPATPSGDGGGGGGGGCGLTGIETLLALLLARLGRRFTASASTGGIPGTRRPC